MQYPITFSRDDDGRVLVHFPDFPEVRAAGEYEADAIVRAREALRGVLARYISERRAVPEPSAHPGRVQVVVPILVQAKLVVYEAMRAAGMGRADLARRLRWHRPQVDRLLDLEHASKMDQVEAALAVLGKHLTLVVQDDAPHEPERSPRQVSTTKDTKATKKG